MNARKDIAIFKQRLSKIDNAHVKDISYEEYARFQNFLSCLSEVSIPEASTARPGPRPRRVPRTPPPVGVHPEIDPPSLHVLR